MIARHDRLILIIAFILLLIGVVLPILMTMRIITSTYFLNFLSFFCSLAGSILGFVGTAYLAVSRRKKRQ
jgi:hypothetical protein